MATSQTNLMGEALLKPVNCPVRQRDKLLVCVNGEDLPEYAKWRVIMGSSQN